MLRSEYEFLTGKLRELETAKKQLLVDMELHHMVDSPEDFDAWWNEEGNLERCRQLSEDAERLSMQLSRAQITEDSGPRHMFAGAAERTPQDGNG
ncbi:MAG: hypothetical protein PUE63_00585 [Lachnospiraceae bacterium]|nr:hypothetical protein [Lachnospiraceae bacterium]